jgi:hypothetical protein
VPPAGLRQPHRSPRLLDPHGADWTAAAFWDKTNSRLGLGSALFTDPAALLELRESGSGTAPTAVLTLTKNTSGVPATDMGPAIAFRGESSTTEHRDMAQMHAGWSAVTMRAGQRISAG